MKKQNRFKQITVDANEAAASVAFRLTEVIAIYPITPSTPMAELSDEWASKGKQNVWGDIPSVCQLQSEGGVAGALHGSLISGSLTTTFTASQGLLLMMPNMYKIAGELTPFCMHVTARSLATHALSIFGDHSDVMACRQTGFSFLVSNSVQEAHDMAAIAHVATLRSRIPFLHFFDGFRTSHEINHLELLDDDTLKSLIPVDALDQFRNNALTPDKPSIRGTAQNPDVFFQAREAANIFYDAVPQIVKEAMADFADKTGRHYDLCEYVGAPDATKVIIVMGSGAETAEQTSQWLNKHQDEKTGVLKVRLYRPFPVEDMLRVLPASVKKIAVLDRTKEPGAIGEPLYQDVLTAIYEGQRSGFVPASFNPEVIGGRYGLGSKEFTPAMAKAIFDHLSESKLKPHFTIGINDDVTQLSLTYDPRFEIEPKNVFRALFFGLGSDGTVGANKNSIKIIGAKTDNFAQAYFVYDSKKSGAMTVSHLRFGPDPIRAPYLISSAQFIGCHQFSFLSKYEVLETAAQGAVFLINSNIPADHLWDQLPRSVQATIIEKEIKLYTIDAYEVARISGMGGRINTVMQTCFFAISGVLDADEAIAHIKDTIEKTYAKKGAEIVRKNFAAVDASLAHLKAVPVPQSITSDLSVGQEIPDEAPDFIKTVTRLMLENKGDLLPVSAFPVDGTWLTGTSKYEKRNVGQFIPSWDPSVCIQCNKCVLVCPHAAIRSKFYPEDSINDAPDAFQSVKFKANDFPGNRFTIQVAPEDCTGCSLCVQVCPAKNKADPKRKAINMTEQMPIRDQEVVNFNYFLNLPNPSRTELGIDVKGSQFREPLFEFSGACAGCGETPYIKLLTQLYGDRMMVANATGCSSIYGGNLPTTPYSVNADGKGPAWANSLFEDNAEFGFGMRVALDQKKVTAANLLKKLEPQLGTTFINELITADQSTDPLVEVQRERINKLITKLQRIDDPLARDLEKCTDYLVDKIVWIIGGDGWAYDIGYGGLDHVLASGRNVNVIVLDTEVYSNTGGQQSKSTPMGSVAKFAAAGKPAPKKDLGLLAMSYGNVYVAKIAMGAKDTQTVQAITEAVNYEGPSLIIAYSHCIAHGFDLAQGMEHQKMAVNSGHWPLYRFDPRRADEGAIPLKLDSRKPKIPLAQFTQNEVRFRMLQLMDPKRAQDLGIKSQAHCDKQYALYEQLASATPATQQV